MLWRRRIAPAAEPGWVVAEQDVGPRMNAKPIIDIVDDDADVLRALSRLLRAYGWVPRAFNSAAAYLNASREPLPDCVLLDVQMPEMNGLDLLAQLRVRGFETPVIFMTAHEDREAEQAAARAGATFFLFKPIRRSQLCFALCTSMRIPVEGC